MALPMTANARPRPAPTEPSPTSVRLPLNHRKQLLPSVVEGALRSCSVRELPERPAVRIHFPARYGHTGLLRSSRTGVISATLEFDFAIRQKRGLKPVTLVIPKQPERSRQ